MLVKVDQDGHGLIIFSFYDHKNIFLDHGGDNWGQEDVIEYFLWDIVIQKSPGKTSYDTTMPRIYIWYSVLEVMITACKTYVDDLQCISATH